MLRTIGRAVLILTALATPSVADVPPAVATVAPTAAVQAEEPCPVPAVDHQVAAAPDCRDCDSEVAGVADRPIRLGKAHYSPIGEAVLNLLRSQGGGHLRP